LRLARQGPNFLRFATHLLQTSSALCKHFPMSFPKTDWEFSWVIVCISCEGLTNTSTWCIMSGLQMQLYRTNLYLDKAQMVVLRKEAKKKHLSVAALVRLIIDQHFSESKKKVA
jgi:hypothetical protein